MLTVHVDKMHPVSGKNVSRCQSYCRKICAVVLLSLEIGEDW